MMKTVLSNGLEAFIGLSSGIVIGGAFIALLTFLGVIPRLFQWVRDASYRIPFTAPLLIGTMCGTYFTFTEIEFTFPPFILVYWGMLQGIFNGMLAAALVEVLHVFPILSKRIGLRKYIRLLIMAVVFGKIVGSLVQWLFLAS